MAINITIDGTTYSLPQQSDSPPWGTQITDIIEALANGLAATIGPNDILPSTFTVANNVTSPIPVTGLIFDQAQVRSAEISYSIDRSTSSSEVSENGILLVNFNNFTNTWTSSQVSNGTSGVTLSISGGQVFYVSNSMAGSSYTGKLGFSAKAFGQ